MPGRPPLLHALGLLLALAPAAGAPAQPPTDAHDDLSSSPARRLSSSACRHGAEGVLISLEPAAYSQSSNASARGARTRAFAASLLARGGSASASAGGNKGGSGGSGSNTVRILHVFDRGNFAVNYKFFWYGTDNIVCSNAQALYDGARFWAGSN